MASETFYSDTRTQIMCLIDIAFAPLCCSFGFQPLHIDSSIMKTRLFKYTENFTTQNENFQIKNSDIFHISAQNIDRGYSLEPPRWGGSNEYPQSMFLSRNKKNNVYPYKPQKWGLRGSELYRYVFVMGLL